MIVFQAFTWQSFLIAAMILSVVWSIGVGLVYYRREIFALFSGGRGKAIEPLPHGWADQVDELAPGLVGSLAEEPGVSVLEADEFSFAVDENPGAPLDPLGDLADVQQEIKSICRILEKEDGTKEDFFSLFEMVRRKYPRVAGSGQLDQLNGFIRDHAPFALSQEELESLWT